MSVQCLCFCRAVMSGAHPGGIQPEHSPHTALRSVELSLPLFTPLWFSLSLPCSGSTLQTFLELFPFSSPDQSSLCESSGLSVDSASPLRLQNTRQLLVAFTSAYFFPPEIPESEPSQSWCFTSVFSSHCSPFLLLFVCWCLLWHPSPAQRDRHRS